MGEFNERSPLSNRLFKEFKKIPESGAELSEKVDKIVVEIKSTADEKKKQKLMEKLLVHIHPLLEKAVSGFYRNFYLILTKHGFSQEDIYAYAVENMMKYTDRWEDKTTREAKGETSSHFTTYLFNNRGLEGRLMAEFITPYYTKKRTRQEVSFNQPISKSESGAELQSILPDQKAEDPLAQNIKKQEMEIGREAVLQKLYSDRDPFLSLVAILRFGMARSVLREWKKQLSSSIKQNKVYEFNEKYIPRINKILDKYEEEEMTLQEIGDLLGITKERVRQKMERALAILRSKMKEI